MDHEELDRAIEKAQHLHEQKAREQQSALQRQRNYFASIPEAAEKLKHFFASPKGLKTIHYLGLTGKTIQIAEGRIARVWVWSSYANAEVRFYLTGTGLMESRPRYNKARKVRLGSPKMCCQLWAEQGKDPMFVVEEINKQMANFLT
jgi:hypothetical protein